MTKNNKISLFLSALAIALVALLIMHFKGMKLVNQVSASGLDNAQAISEINEYINSLDSLTADQKNAISSLIQDYIDNHPDLTEADLASLYQLIDQKSQSNVSNLENIRNELQLQLNSLSISDSSRYNELKNLIDEINILIADMKNQNSNTNANYNEVISDLQEAITKLNNRTTDMNGAYEFNFGYKDGCYGYYIDGNNFRPF